MDIDAREVRRWREQGLSQQACADKLGLSRDQLRRRSKKDPALLEALRPVPGAPKKKGDTGKAGAAHNKAQAAKRKTALIQVRRQSNRPPAYVDPELMAWRLAEYMYLQDQQEKPYTIHGLYRALGISGAIFYEYRNGSRDDKTYKLIVDDRPLQSREGQTDWLTDIYRDKIDYYPYMYYLSTGTSLPDGATYTKEVIKKMLAGQQSTFSEIIKNALLPLQEDVESHTVGGKLGDVTRANVILGWRQETQQTVVHTLDPQLAQERMKALGYSKK